MVTRAKRKLPPCFECGKYLWGSTKLVLKNTIDNYPRTFHKECGNKVLKENPTEWELVN